MKKHLAFIVMFLVTLGISAQDLPTQHHEAVTDFINCFKNNDRETLAGLVIYPLKREYPLPAIKNKVEFLKRYDEVFDSKLVAMIKNSSLSKDWSAVGWRGIMLNNGDLWLDYDGTLIGVNYQSPAEVNRKTQLIASEKETLHSSIKKFSEPVCILLTPTYRIRIDEMEDGNYRYVSWKTSSKMSDKPDVIVYNGKVFPDGSGGNHHYMFKNGKYTYECGITLIGGEEGDMPAYLIVYKKDKEILNQQADLVEP